MATHHDLDVKPVPEKVLYINEPQLVDASYDCFETWSPDLDAYGDNIRVYVPLDINAEAIMRRLRYLVHRYGETNERNESNFSLDVGRLVSQIEIYDQVLFARGHRAVADENGAAIGKGHSAEATELVKRFVAELEVIPDGCAELFPFELIDELRREYGMEERMV